MNENLKEQAPQTEVIPVTEEKVEKKKKNNQSQPIRRT